MKTGYSRVSKRRKRVRRIKRLLQLAIVAGFVVVIYLLFLLFSVIGRTIEGQKETESENVTAQEEMEWEKEEVTEDEVRYFHEGSARQRIDNFARKQGLSLQDYPEEVIEALEKNPETEEFVLNYPLKKDEYERESLVNCLNRSRVPLLLQWDERWGYYKYGSSLIGVAGCGPTCLSMVAIHLLQDARLTPIYMADYAENNGFYVEGSGTAWAFMTSGARQLGLSVWEVSLDESVVTQHLLRGRPIICAMGPGDFTTQGHFIVLVGVKNGKIIINDPNSRIRSEKLWSFDEFKYQIKNMWVYDRGK